MFDDFYRKAVFFVGDVRRLSHFPWFTWSVREHQVDFGEVLEALPVIQYGDVGLHRDSGYLSNLAIPGFMKHAWLHTDDGIENPLIVEAISDGVVYRNAIYPMYSDYTIILRPKGVGYKERRGACRKAKSIVGTRYDYKFEFNIEEELRHYQGTNPDSAMCDLYSASKYMSDYDHAFSCTEVVGYSWWHMREQLRIYRERSRGKDVILADSFLNGGFDIVWASNSVTVDIAAEMNLHEEGIEMIRKFIGHAG